MIECNGYSRYPARLQGLDLPGALREQKHDSNTGYGKGGVVGWVGLGWWAGGAGLSSAEAAPQRSVCLLYPLSREVLSV